VAVQQVLLIRHGETAWSLSGQHTGISDIALTENGRQVAARWRPLLTARSFELVLTSPLQRARQTCQLAGLGEQAQIDRDLMEWDYGRYEGLTSQQIRSERPGWMVFRDGCPEGESPEQVAERVDRVIARVRDVKGDVALFAHGHVLRVLGARWIGLDAIAGSHFLLDPATASVLSAYRGVPAIKRWNAPLMITT
jgi:broad specificity phosphatase PhoE